VNTQTSLFPKTFSWGVAASAYQIEGAAAKDGRGPSVWDTFCKRSGAIFQGHSGDVACDHYHRYREDIRLMKALGIRSYRFSVSWSRILPGGIGKPNPKGLAFYDRLIDHMLESDLEPFCTIFHWDYPEALYARGGWLNRDSAGWFGDYSSVVAKAFSDRVKRWTTQNEPQCFIGLALLEGLHAPGDKLTHRQFLTAAHNAMRAHGRCVQALRAYAPLGHVGFAISAQVAQPASATKADVAAARTAMFAVTGRHPWNNSWWTEPVLRAEYPADGLALWGRDMPRFPSRDLDEMRQPLDYIGLNLYSAQTYRRGDSGAPEKVPFAAGYPRSGVDWQPITPGCLYWGPRFFYERYGLPIAVTENGLSTRDQLFLDGNVHDPQRIDYIHRGLLELARAIKDKVQVLGYWFWSLLDNFEWADGYKQRFGLIYVDFETQKRIPKDSFYWYRKVVRSNGSFLRRGRHLPATQVTSS